MRAISPHPRYSLQLIEAPVKRGTDSSGTIVEYQDSKPVIAEFRQLGLLDWEQVAALEHFSFAGLADGVHPLSQVSAYDTEAEALRNNWDARYLYEVDKRLEHLAAMFPAQCLVVRKPPQPRPWASYDEQGLEEILATLEQTGNDPADVRIYELENQAREDVIAAMEELQASAVVDPSAVPAPSAHVDPELAKLRAELEALKALLAPAEPTVASTPLPKVDEVPEFGDNPGQRVVIKSPDGSETVGTWADKPKPATPIHEGVAGTGDTQTKVDPLAKARAAKALKAAERAANEVTVDV